MWLFSHSEHHIIWCNRFRVVIDIVIKCFVTFSSGFCLSWNQTVSNQWHVSISVTAIYIVSVNTVEVHFLPCMCWVSDTHWAWQWRRIRFTNFEVFTVVWLRIIFFWDVMFYQWVSGYCYFEGTHYLHCLGLTRSTVTHPRKLESQENCLFGAVIKLMLKL